MTARTHVPRTQTPHAPLDAALAALAAAILVAAPATAGSPPEMVELEPAQDTSIYSQFDFANGSGPGLFTGRTGAAAGGAANRALIEFDVSSIPADADVVSVELRLYLEQAAEGSGDRPVTLRRLTASWGEGGSVASNGLGAPPQTDDATWTKRFHPGTLWTTAGGDLAASTSATVLCPEATDVVVTWSSSGLVDDVETWLDDPSSNHGWAIVGDESEIRTGRRFASRETMNLIATPTLVVVYEAGGSDCEGDVDGSGDVGFGDILAVLTAWGTADPDADIDDSGEVGFGDLLIVLTNYGPC